MLPNYNESRRRRNKKGKEKEEKEGKGKERAENQGQRPTTEPEKGKRTPVINKKVHGHQNCTLPVYSVHSSRTFGRPLNPKISKVIPRVKNIDGTHGVALQSKQLTLTVAPCPHSYHGGSPIVIGVEDLWYVQKE